MNKLLVIFILSALCYADDAIQCKSNYFGIDPISLCFGSINLDYEYVIAQHHGIFIEGFYSLPFAFSKSYSASSAYRYHITAGCRKSFLGPFCNIGRIEAFGIDDDDSRYYYTLDFVSLGVNWGYRRKVFKKIPITLRIGAGYPFYKFKWKQDTPSTIMGIKRSFYRKVALIGAVLDGEFTITFSL